MYFIRFDSARRLALVVSKDIASHHFSVYAFRCAPRKHITSFLADAITLYRRAGHVGYAACFATLALLMRLRLLRRGRLIGPSAAFQLFSFKPSTPDYFHFHDDITYASPPMGTGSADIPAAARLRCFTCQRSP